MGKIMSMMVKPVKKFNIENRAHAVISREKPEPAPSYESTRKQLDVARTVNPTFMEEHYKKDASLDDRLKNVYVRSYDPPNPEAESHTGRELPLSRTTEEEFEYGFWEPQHVSEGRCTLRTAITFMSDHDEDPVKNSESEIARKYKLKAQDVSNILTYYRVYKIVVPKANPGLAYTERVPIAPGLREEK